MTNIPSLSMTQFACTKEQPQNNNSFRKDVFFQKMDKHQVSDEAKEAIWNSFDWHNA